eukprot:6422849-Prymnesium_polylepis.1
MGHALLFYSLRGTRGLRVYSVVKGYGDEARARTWHACVCVTGLRGEARGRGTRRGDAQQCVCMFCANIWF